MCLVEDTVDSLIDSGFVIVGDSLKEVPDEIVSMVRNGGSLEGSCRHRTA